MSEQVLIHCQEDYLDSLQQLNLRLLDYEYDAGQVTAIVDNNQSLNDVELCSHYGIDYNKVRELELI